MTEDVRAVLEASRDSLTVVRSFGADERARRAEIIEQARMLASAQGYQGLTIRAVAAAANTTPVTIYRYFGSKDGLAQQLMAEWALGTLDRLSGLDFDEDVTESDRIAAAFAHLIDWAAEDRKLLGAGLASVHTNTTGTGIGLWQPLFVELVRSALAEPEWEDTGQRAVVLGHVLTTCLIDLTAGSGDIAAIRDTIGTAARLIFGE
ncbi:TetR/AcrR family transcriptional regulator [Gordonia sp. NPDC003504]